jgi:uncharacterized protein
MTFPLLIKPVSHCPMDCVHCWQPHGGHLGAPDKMGRGTFERLIELYKEAGGNQVIWQAEPTVMGLEWMRWAKAIMGPKIRNAFQTNALTLTRRWAKFFKENNWFLGVSLNGPTNQERGMVTEKITTKLALLREFGVEYNVLCLVSRENAAHPTRVVRFLAKHATNVQFIPAQPLKPGDDEFAVSPEEWAYFLRVACEDAPDGLTVENAEQTRLAWSGTYANCELSPTGCGSYLVVDHAGDFYPCDFFTEDAWRIGNIHETEDLGALFKRSKRLGEFRAKKKPHSECISCAMRPACNAGCPRWRYLVKEDFKSKDPLCHARFETARRTR